MVDCPSAFPFGRATRLDGPDRHDVAKMANVIGEAAVSAHLEQWWKARSSLVDVSAASGRG
jgi:hypothetical protein